MSERNLAGVSDKNIETDRQNDIYHDDVEKVYVI